jgi:uncharacterized protein with beta-barrel porin domain
MSASNHKVAGLLTGVSLVTLSFLTGRGTAVAAGTTLHGTGSKTIATNFDFVNIRNPANFSLVTNNATIGPGITNSLAGPHQAIAVGITTAATVGQFVNNKVIQAHEGTAAAIPTATATGMLVNGTVPLITNNGLIQALAVAHGTTTNAAAFARGISEFSTGVATAAFALVNNNRVAATAIAHGTGQSAYAVATGVQQVIDNSVNGSASITNSAAGTIFARAQAISTGGQVTAAATANAIRQRVTGISTNTAFRVAASLANSGKITALATATAVGSDRARARARAFGVSQYVADAQILSALVTNSGSIEGIAKAVAVGSHGTAYAVAAGVQQQAAFGAAAYLTNNNTGAILGQASAFISGTKGVANAKAFATGASQFAFDVRLFNALLTNSSSGTISALAKATAVGGTAAHVRARASAVGVSQFANDVDVSNLTVVNSGHILAQAHALASNSSRAFASASAYGVFQGAGDDSQYLNASVTNNAGGSIGALAVAIANGSHSATAYARAYGVWQSGEVEGAAVLSVVNSGSILGQASAHAVGTSGPRASASAIGVFQRGGEPDAAMASVVNNSTGVIQGLAKATALGFDAGATAYAAGVYQSSDDARAVIFSVANSGRIFAQAGALAVASTGEAHASAYAVGVRQFGNTDEDRTAFTASVTNSAGASIVGVAQAVARGSAEAFATAYAWGVSQRAGAGAISFTVTNSGSIAGSAAAFASAPHGFARASATAYGVLQATEDGFGPTFTAVVNNSGNISAKARATAIGDVSANAFAFGVLQTADDYSLMNFTVANSGSIIANAVALAKGIGTISGAFASAVGVKQIGTDFGILNASVTNSAGAVIAANAVARQSATTPGPVTDVRAFAFGVSQSARDGGLASLTVTNSGQVQAQASGYAFALHGSAQASANATGVFQNAQEVAGATLVVTNNATGGIFAIARATAHGAATATANASASAYGVAQLAGGEGGFASLTVNNSGSIGALAQAAARGGSARAVASAYGIYQSFDFITQAVATVNNSGAINASALAKAVGTRFSTAIAHATGIAVSAFTPGTPFVVSIANSGNIRAFANAAATGATGTHHALAEASAVGIFVRAGGSGVVSGIIEGTISNSGHIFASAIVGHGSAGFAHAVGIWDPSGLNDTTITNTGLINAYAQVPNTGMKGGVMGAYATGILISGFESDGGPVSSGALLAAPAGSNPAPAIPGRTLVVNDGGTIWAGQSQNGGQTFQRGNAINTLGLFVPGTPTTSDPTPSPLLAIESAPNQVVIQLQGTNQPGHIFGDILLGSHVIGNNTVDDEVDIFNGKTFFDGIVNDPNKIGQLLYSASTSATPPFAPPGYPFVGAFNIQNGGKLVLCQEGWTLACDSGGGAWANAGPGGAGFDPATGKNGPAYVFSNTFTVASGATLAYQLTPLSTPSSATGVFTNPSGKPLTTFTPGNYPQVFANIAHLSGTVQAAYLPGFYNNATTYAHVIEAGTLTGGFTSVTDNSILLNTTAEVHDGSPGFVNLNVTRTPFGGVSGLTQNQSAAGGGIEKVYNQLPAPGTNPATLGSTSQGLFAKLVANLFTIDNAGDYAKALDQLAGSQYAQQLQSVIWSTRELNQTVTDRMECNIEGAAMQTNGKPASNVPGCFQPGQWTAWVQTHGSWDRQKGDSNAPGYNEGQYGVYLGADYAFTADWFLGATAGYFNSNMNFNNWGGVSGGSIRYDGFQVAGYGGYDDRVWYARGILAYGNYSGSSSRFISIAGAPVDPHGSPDAGVLSFYGEAGHRFTLTPDWTGTPFLGLGVSHGWLNSFTETDEGTGANLAIGDSSGTSVASRLGGRLSTVWGAFTPEVSLAWQHEFGDTTQTVNAAFASAPTGANFSVISANTGRDGAALAAGLSYALGPQNKISVQYDGFFTGDYYSNAVMGRWTAKW